MSMKLYVFFLNNVKYINKLCNFLLFSNLDVSSIYKKKNIKIKIFQKPTLNLS